MKKITYKSAGVDVRRADGLIDALRMRTKGGPGAFGSFFDLARLRKRYRNPVLVSSADGVGTKLLIAQQLNRHRGVGIDLVGMNVNDIICLGAVPLFFLDYIACGRLNTRMLSSVVKGIRRGLKEANCTLCGGETAQMPGMYKKDEYDLAGFCVGILERGAMITGKNIRAGDCIIGLASSGLHSNGFSLVRRVFTKNEIKKHASALLRPTRIYVKGVLSLLRCASLGPRAISGIAHITGGGFYRKAIKVLPGGVGMRIERKRWPVPQIFSLIQKKGGISDREMFTVFNMGIGMMLVVKKRYAQNVLKRINSFYRAWRIGKVVASSQKMIVQ